MYFRTTGFAICTYITTDKNITILCIDIMELGMKIILKKRRRMYHNVRWNVYSTYMIQVFVQKCFVYETRLKICMCASTCNM
jgi:hypothetical protein